MKQPKMKQHPSTVEVVELIFSRGDGRFVGGGGARIRVTTSHE